MSILFDDYGMIQVLVFWTAKNLLFINLKASNNQFQLSMLVLPLSFIFFCNKIIKNKFYLKIIIDNDYKLL